VLNGAELTIHFNLVNIILNTADSSDYDVGYKT